MQVLAGEERKWISSLTRIIPTEPPDQRKLQHEQGVSNDNDVRTHRAEPKAWLGKPSLPPVAASGCFASSSKLSASASSAPIKSGVSSEPPLPLFVLSLVLPFVAALTRGMCESTMVECLGIVPAG